MEEKYYSESDNQVEIDLAGLCWELLMQWKPILLCMLLCGCLVMPIMGRMEIKEYNLQREQIQKMISDLDSADGKGDASSFLSDEERVPVSRLLTTYRQLLNQQSLYDLSLRFGWDIPNQKNHRYVFRLHAENAGDLPALRDAYIDWFGNTAVKDKVADIYGIKPMQSGQVFAVWAGGADSTSVSSADVSIIMNIIYDTDAELDKMKELVRKCTEQRQKEVTSIVGAHTFTLINEDDRIGGDYGVRGEKLDYLSRIDDYKKSLFTAYGEFTEAQQEAFKRMLPKANEDFGFTEETAPIHFGSIRTQESVGKAPASSMNPAHFVMGLFVGLLLYVAVFVVVWLFSPRMRRSTELADTMGVRSIGEVHTYPAVSALAVFFRSKWIYNKRYAKQPGIEEGLAIIADRISLLPDGEEDILVVSPTSLSAGQKELADRIVKESERPLSLVLADEAKSVAIEKRLVAKPQVLLLSLSGKTKAAEAWGLFRVCRRYGAVLAGHILIEAP